MDKKRRPRDRRDKKGENGKREFGRGISDQGGKSEEMMSSRDGSVKREGEWEW